MSGKYDGQLERVKIVFILEQNEDDLELVLLGHSERYLGSL